MTTYIYGASDDLIELDGDLYEEFNLPYGEDEPYYVAFSNGLLIKITYDGDWNLKIVSGSGAKVYTAGTETEERQEGWPEHMGDYTDLVVIEDDVKWAVGGTSIAKAKKS